MSLEGDNWQYNADFEFYTNDDNHDGIDAAAGGYYLLISPHTTGSGN